MRLQDKLLWLYETNRHTGLRRYLSRDLARVVAGPDSECALEHLERAAGSTEQGEALQARLGVATFWSRHVGRRFGTDTPLISVVVGADDAGHHSDAIARAPLEAASRLAREALLSVISHVRSAPVEGRWLPLIAIAPFPLPEIDSLLMSLVEGDPPDALAAFLIARRSLQELSAGEIAPALERAATRDPEALVALAELRCEPRIATAVAANRRKPVGRWTVPAGIALGATTGRVRSGLFDDIVASRHGWGVVHALASLSRVGGTEDLAPILKVFKRYEHPLVRTEVARCLGRLRTPEARDVTHRIIARDPSSPEAGAALESLVRQGMPDPDRLKIFGSLLKTSNPEVFACACLGLVALEPERAASGVLKLLAAGHEARLHGLHVLGYLPTVESARLLARYAAQDPEAAARRQALASLCLHPPSEALRSLLLDLVVHIEPRSRPFAARALIRTQEAADATVLERLARAAATSEGAVRQSLLEVIGSVGGVLAQGHVQRIVGKVTESDDLVGALSAAATSRQRWKNVGSRRMLDDPDRRVAAAASLAMLQDDLEAALATIGRLIQAPDGSFDEGVRTLGTVGRILERCLTHPRYQYLLDRMATQAGPQVRSNGPPGFDAPREPPEAEDATPEQILVGSSGGGQLAAAGKRLEREVLDPGMGPDRFEAGGLEAERLDRPLGDRTLLMVVVVVMLAMAAVAGFFTARAWLNREGASLPGRPAGIGHGHAPPAGCRDGPNEEETRRGQDPPPVSRSRGCDQASAWLQSRHGSGGDQVGGRARGKGGKRRGSG
ncbi:MAG: hypothetical protein HY815_25135, partial [Candidatus Riflebacteria bacterium]|nr:hypothetical protein [Candidatus Riflebacteria bacterium]